MTTSDDSLREMSELTGHDTRAAGQKRAGSRRLKEMRHEEEAAGDGDRVLGEGYGEVG